MRFKSAERLIDQQGLFNLNNLQVAPNSPQQDVYGDQFRNLLSNLKDVTIAGDLVPAIRDWMDKNQDPGFPGAEDSVYLNLSPPYRTADQPFSSVSELRAVQGVTAEIYTALLTQCPVKKDGTAQTCITALPFAKTGVPTKINVNTAPELVLRSLSKTVDDSKLQSFLSSRENNPEHLAATFIARNIYGADVTEALVDVKTNYFQLNGEVFVGSSRVALYSLINRINPGQAGKIIFHSTGEN